MHTRPLLAIIALSGVQSSIRTFSHNAILVIDTSNNDSYNQAQWLIGTPYLSIVASNVVKKKPKSMVLMTVVVTYK